MNRVYEQVKVLSSDVKSILYDVPSNSMFKVDPEYFAQVSESSEEYQLFLDQLLGQKEVTEPTDDLFSYDRGVLKKLTIHITSACNLRCKYCYAGQGKFDDYQEETLSPERARSFLRNIVGEQIHEIRQIMFFGGEPLIGYPTIEAICQEVDCLIQESKLKQRPFYTMVSNFTICNDRVKAMLEEYDVRVTVSLDGPAEINDALRIYPDSRGSFHTVLENIRSCLPNVTGIECTYTKVHEQKGMSREDLKTYICDLIPSIARSRITICDAVGNDLDICFGQGSTGKASAELNTDNVSILAALKPECQSKLLCTTGFVSFSVMQNGDLYPCHMYAVDRAFKIGSCVDAVDYEALKDTVYEKLGFVNKDSHQQCATCWGRKFCHRCPAKQLLTGRKAEKVVDDSRCDAYLHYAEKVLVQYFTR